MRKLEKNKSDRLNEKKKKKGSCVKKSNKTNQTEKQSSLPLIYYSNEMVFYHPLDIWKGSINFFHNISSTVTIY